MLAPMSVLSIISPIYNSAPYLRELLGSVERLQIPHEHVVVDGGSTDDTVAILEARERPELRWTSEPDRGQTHAVNKGIERSTGDLITWINGDNAYLPGALERAVATLNERPDFDAIFGGIMIVDERGEVRRTYVPPPWSWRRYVFIGDYVPTETIIWRRSLLNVAPALDERWADAADYDFFLRLLHGRNVARIPDPVIRYRYHPDSKTGRNPWLAQGEHRAIRAQWARNALDRAVMRAIDRTKRAVLPRISSWPRPWAAGDESLLQRSVTRLRSGRLGQSRR
jgi:glycosyltransferase involved in cell wall biosynthesis